MNFWEGLETAIFFLTSINPKKKLKYDDYSSIHTELHENSKLDCPNAVTKEDAKNLLERLEKFKRCPESAEAEPKKSAAEPAEAVKPKKSAKHKKSGKPKKSAKPNECAERKGVN